MNTLLDAFTLGALQGIAEWLPVSSAGIIALVYTTFSTSTLSDIIGVALFLHLGTFFAALVYFHAEVISLTRAFFAPQHAEIETRCTVRFILIATTISGIIGYILLSFIKTAEGALEISGAMITGIVGVALLVTAGMQFIQQNRANRGAIDINTRDGVLLGILQGLAVIPGISRSGITVAGLLLSRAREETALTLSFLLSMPIVLAGNIILNWRVFTSFNAELVTALIASFVFGLATIHFLLRIARTVPFRWFVLVFAILTLASLFI